MSERRRGDSVEAGAGGQGRARRRAVRFRLRGALAWLGTLILIHTTAAAAASQTLGFGVGAIDMLGGPVWPRSAETGVAFGARVGLATLFDRKLSAGFELDWWTADRSDSELVIRDIVAGIAVWRGLALGDAVRPFAGAGTAVHAVDASSEGGAGFPGGESRAAKRLDGYRVGVSGFAGLSVRVTGTGSIWLVGEYRYTAVRKVPNHEVRAGVRLRVTRH